MHSWWRHKGVTQTEALNGRKRKRRAPEERAVREAERRGLWHGRARYVALRGAHPRQHGALIHSHHHGRPDRRADPAAVLFTAPAALRGAEYRHVEAPHAAGKRHFGRDVLNAQITRGPDHVT